MPGVFIRRRKCHMKTKKHRENHVTRIADTSDTATSQELSRVIATSKS